MSSLIPERPLLVSPSLAATIGLEEALLYQLLAEWHQLNSSNNGWHSIPKRSLADQLPFWDGRYILQVLVRIKDQGLISLGSELSSQSPQLRFALTAIESPTDNTAAVIDNSPAQAPTQTPAPTAASRTQWQAGATQIADNWQPEKSTADYLTNFLGIPEAHLQLILPEFVAYWREDGKTKNSWSSAFIKHAKSSWEKERSKQQAESRKVAIDNQWQPSEDTTQLLLRDQVSGDFIEDAVAEFIIKWQERGHARDDWNSLFIQHIRQQWHRFCSVLDHDRTPQVIPANWEPSEEFYDVLQLAQIDQTFADQLIPEFVLFWRDTGEIQRSWNSKFLQHVKYQWATRHNIGQQHAGQQNHPASGTAAKGFIEKHTDRSWREGL